MDKPSRRPANPSFSSGPCAKRPGWSAAALRTDALGRSHRSSLGKARLEEAIELTRAVLEVPDSHLVGIVPASDTGAYEMAMWTMLGARPVSALAWESFGQGWVTDAVKQLKIEPIVTSADYGRLPDLGSVDTDTDVLFTWNGTTSGVRVPDGTWIADDRQGLTLCDATSAAFAQDLPWAKLDVVTYSWQKVLGGEAQHGVLILGPRAVERLESYTPPWPLPKLFRLTKGGKLIEGIFRGETINTPSLLCVEDQIDALTWAEGIGGLPALKERATDNARVLWRWMGERDWVSNLAEDPGTRSNTSVCMRITDPRVAGLPEEEQRAFQKRMEKRLAAEGAAYDVGAYRDAPPGLRVWCGATVERADVEALTGWLDWAFEAETAGL
jgi:phosphoserine aminotransferase